MVSNRLLKGLLWMFVLSFAMLPATGILFACPTLQLDIEGGTYDLTTQTIIGDDSFTLYAYLIPDGSNTLSDEYYISAALVPMVTTESELGSFDFDGDTVNVTEDMVYGVPPLETIIASDPKDLPTHGIYETYFWEYEFQFDEDNEIAEYDTQDRAESGDSIPASGDGMYYVAFTIDTSLLDTDYVIHFDLYNTKVKCSGDIDVTQFAPFSHDAESSHPVPEPKTFILLGIGLLGLGIYGLYGRRKSRTEKKRK